MKKNPRISAPKLADDIANNYNKHVHPRTVRRALRENGYKSRGPRKRPLISEKTENLDWSLDISTETKTLSFGKEFFLQTRANLIYLEAMAVQRSGASQTLPFKPKIWFLR